MIRMLHIDDMDTFGGGNKRLKSIAPHFENGKKCIKLTNHPTTELKKRRQFRKFTYRGIDLDQYVPATLFISVIAISTRSTKKKKKKKRERERKRLTNPPPTITDSSTSPPSNSVMLCTLVPVVGSTVA